MIEKSEDVTPGVYLIRIVIMTLLFVIGINADTTVEKGGHSSPDPKVVEINHKIFGRCMTKIKDGRTSMAYIELKPEKVWNQTPYNNSTNFIRNIKAKVSNKEVLNISFGNPISFKYRGVRFNFEDFSPYAKNIEYKVTDNYGTNVKKSCDIFRKNTISKKRLDTAMTNTLADDLNQKVWRATTIDEVIELLYGTESKKKIKKSEITNKIQIMCSNSSLDAMPKKFRSEEQCLKSVNYNIGTKILSSKELESVALLYTGNEFPLIFFAKFTNNSRLPLRVLTRFYKEGTLLLLAKDKNGKLYSSKSYFLNTGPVSSLYEAARLDFYIN